MKMSRVRERRSCHGRYISPFGQWRTSGLLLDIFQPDRSPSIMRPLIKRQRDTEPCIPSRLCALSSLHSSHAITVSVLHLGETADFNSNSRLAD